MRKHAQSGQALLLVLLTMATLLTLVLSVVSRSVSEVSITTQEEESTRAFSAAEAGIEEALVAALPAGESISESVGETTPDGPVDARFQANVDTFPENSQEYLYPRDLLAGDTATIWLVEHDADNNLVDAGGFVGSTLRVCWGKEGTDINKGYTPAVEVTVAYDDAGTLNISRQAYDRRTRNEFARISGRRCSVDGETLEFYVDIDFSSLGITSWNREGGLRSLSVRMLYNSNEAHPIGITSAGGSNIPSQGTKVDSIGTSGGSSRRVEVFSLYPEVPSMFNSAIFSPQDIAK